MKQIIKMVAVAAVLAAPGNAMATYKVGDSKNIIFHGRITHTCTITVDTTGTLGVSVDFQTLDSTISGGSAGTATIAATGNGFKISVDAPTLAKPAGDTTPETMDSSYTASGATSVSGTDTDAPKRLKRGTTNVSVDMAAEKSGSDVFEAGLYTGTVVLRCE